jgi:hypothetical protein
MAWPKSQRISQLRFQSLTHAPALLTRGLLERQLADANVPPAILHREMVTFYLQQISALHKALQNDAEATRQDHCSNVVIRIGLPWSVNLLTSKLFHNRSFCDVLLAGFTGHASPSCNHIARNARPPLTPQRAQFSLQSLAVAMISRCTHRCTRCLLTVLTLRNSRFNSSWESLSELRPV